MAGISLPLEVCKGTVSGLWKTAEIPTGHRAHNALRHEATPTYNQSQKGDASQLEAMSHIPLSVLTPQS